MPEFSTLLSDSDLAPFEIVNKRSQNPLLLVCDHAANNVPQALADLGISAQDLASHIGWDPGAAAVARLMAEQLNATLILSNYSRLVIDCNRPLSSADLIPEQSAGIIIPGNLQLANADKQKRIDELFWPYHRAIDDLLDASNEQGLPRILLSIHSFTPVLNQQARPWHVGVACRHDDRLAKLFYQALAAPGDLVVGFNEPYIIDDNFDYTVPVQGEGRKILCAMIEIRQDGLTTPQNIAAWAERLSHAYQQVIAT